MPPDALPPAEVDTWICFLYALNIQRVMGEPLFIPDITRHDLVKVSAVILATMSLGVYECEAMLVIAASPGVLWDQNASFG